MAATTLVRHKVAFVAHSYGSHLQKYINVTPQCDPDFHLAQADVSWCFKGGWTWEIFWADPRSFLSVYEAKLDVIFTGTAHCCNLCLGCSCCLLALWCTNCDLGWGVTQE